MFNQTNYKFISGGPLMTVDDTTDPIRPYYYLAGLVSFGPSPCGKFLLNFIIADDSES